MIKLNLSLENIPEIEDGIALCLGYFDGLHLGHRQIIENAVENSKYPVGVLTFDKPISEIIECNKSKEVLTSLQDKNNIVKLLGVDYFLVFKLEKDFLDKTAEEFMEILRAINVKEIYVGEDYTFGKNKGGNVELLKQNFNVHVTPILKVNDEKVSTQSIIKLIKDGEMYFANKLLGRNFEVNGQISEGHHNGAKLGFKTANIKLSCNYVIPRFGVYKVLAKIEGVEYLAIANVGIHPTIDEENEPIIEVHIPGFDKDCYGEEIQVQFLDFVRPEIKFSNTEDLINQIQSDLNVLL